MDGQVLGRSITVEELNVIKAQPLNRDWESVLGSWGAAPSATEQTKCENAERAIRKAIDASGKLSSKNIEVFAQGSYANRTNVREDSDVDICILCKNTFFPNYAMSEGLNDAVFGFSAAQYRYADFKNDVEARPEVLLRGGLHHSGNQSLRRSREYVQAGCRSGAMF